MAQTQLSPTFINFGVQIRGKPQLIAPSKPTPYEIKPLSDIDNLDSLKSQIPALMFYPNNPSMDGVDPAKVIRSAIAQTLVFYYPLAGRLREDGVTGRLTVECTGEGILFIEADADVTLDQFGYPLVPPFSCLDQLLVGFSDPILNTPLLLIQVTRLKCGGFIFGVRLNHTICDGAGGVQFLSAVAEIAKGATSPSVSPVWERHVLTKNPSEKNNYINIINDHVDDIHHHENLLIDDPPSYKAFMFGPIEISALRKCLPLHLRHCSSFEIVTAAVWKCRVAALELANRTNLDATTTESNLIWVVNLRSKRLNEHFIIPSGYYGNAIRFALATSTVMEILKNPLCYTLQLLRNAKETVINTNRESGVTVKNATIATTRRYLVSDLRHSGLDEVDFGWGKAVYAGIAGCVPMVGWYQMHKDMIMLPICLPNQAMGRFQMELNNIMFKDQIN